MTYGSWDMQWERQNWLSFWAIFCLFTPLTAQKIKILKNEKSIWRCRQFTHACTCNFHNLYASWDMECDRHNFLSFSAIFCPFTQLTCWKIKIFKKKIKISGDIIILLLCTTNDGHMMYGSWDTECDRIFLILYHFCPFTPLKTLKCKILKKQTKKQTNAFRYHHFTQVYHK